MENGANNVMNGSSHQQQQHTNGYSNHSAMNGDGPKMNGINNHQMNGGGGQIFSNGGQSSSCCPSEQGYDQRFQEGLDFLKDAVDMCMNEAVPQYTDRNSKIVEFVEPDEMKTKFNIHNEGNATPSKIKLLAILRDVIKYSVKTAHPHFFNQLFGGMEPYALAGALMTDVLNSSQYTYEVAPVFTVMERSLFDEIRRIIGFQQGDGIFCPGGSISNMYALNLARYKKFPEAKTKGLRHLPQMCIATSDKSHYSLSKGAALLGIGMDYVLKVKTDQRGKMIPDELDAVLTRAEEQGMVPIMVNATAGTTVQGAYDPLTPIADVSQKHGAWLHVDAAWGGGVLLSDKLRHKMDGIHRADSVTWNLHKMIGAPQQTSMFVTRHETILKECHSASATYLFQQDKFYDVSYDTGDKSVQCGRRVDVLKSWIMWKAKGSKRMGEEVEHLFHCAKYLLEKLESRPEFRLVNKEPECTNVTFWYIPPRLQNQEETSEWWQEVAKVAPKIKERMVMKGSLMIGYQPEGERVNFFRVVLANLAVKLEDMDFIIDEISRLGQDL